MSMDCEDINEEELSMALLDKLPHSITNHKKIRTQFVAEENIDYKVRYKDDEWGVYDIFTKAGMIYFLWSSGDMFDSFVSKFGLKSCVIAHNPKIERNDMLQLDELMYDELIFYYWSSEGRQMDESDILFYNNGTNLKLTHTDFVHTDIPLYIMSYLPGLSDNIADKVDEARFINELRKEEVYTYNPEHLKKYPHLFTTYKPLKVVIPENIEKIDCGVFSNGFLETGRLYDLTIKSGVKTIEQGAFGGCQSLRYVTIEDGLEEIEDTAFTDDYNLQKINFPDSLKSIGEMCFWNCKKLQNITIPKNVQYIGADAFGACNINEIRIGGEYRPQIFKKSKIFKELNTPITLNWSDCGIKEELK